MLGTFDENTIFCAGNMTTLQYIFLLCNISINILPSHFFQSMSMAIYSRRNNFVLGNLTFAMFDREEVSSIRCGHLCLEKSCCKGYMYSRTIRRCVGLQFDDFRNTGDINLTFSPSKGMVPYLKGILKLFSPLSIIFVLKIFWIYLIKCSLFLIIVWRKRIDPYNPYLA